MNTFATILSYELKKRNYSNKDFAEMTGITEAAISRYTNGQRNPTLENLIIISKKLNVSIDYLAGQTKYPSRPSNDDPESTRLLSCYNKATDDDKNVVWAVLNKYARLI